MTELGREESEARKGPDIHSLGILVWPKSRVSGQQRVEQWKDRKL